MSNQDSPKNALAELDKVDIPALVLQLLGTEDDTQAEEQTTAPTPSTELSATVTYIQDSLQMIADGEVPAQGTLMLLREDLARALGDYAGTARTSTAEDGVRHYAGALLDPSTDLVALADRLHAWATDPDEGPRDFHVTTALETVVTAIRGLAAGSPQMSQ